MDVDERLAPVLNKDDSVDLVKLGRIEQDHVAKRSLTDSEQAARDAALEMWGPWVLIVASRKFKEHCEQQVREHGGTRYTQHVQIRNGRRTTERRVERFPPPSDRVVTADVGRAVAAPRLVREAPVGRKGSPLDRARSRATAATMPPVGSRPRGGASAVTVATTFLPIVRRRPNSARIGTLTLTASDGSASGTANVT